MDMLLFRAFRCVKTVVFPHLGRWMWKSYPDSRPFNLIKHPMHKGRYGVQQFPMPDARTDVVV